MTPDVVMKLAELDSRITRSGMQWLGDNLDANLEFQPDNPKKGLNGLKLNSDDDERRLVELQHITRLVQEVASPTMLNLGCRITVTGEAGWQNSQQEFDNLQAKHGARWKTLATERAKLIAQELGLGVGAADEDKCIAANAKRVVINGIAGIRHSIEKSRKQIQRVNNMKEVVEGVLRAQIIEVEGNELHLKGFQIGLPLKPITLDATGQMDASSVEFFRQAYAFLKPRYTESPAMSIEPPAIVGKAAQQMRSSSRGSNAGSRARSASGASNAGGRSSGPRPPHSPGAITKGRVLKKQLSGAMLAPMTSSLVNATTENVQHSHTPRGKDLVNAEDSRPFENAMEALVQLVECGFVDPEAPPFLMGAGLASTLQVEGFVKKPKPGQVKLQHRDEPFLHRLLQLQDFREQVALALLVETAGKRGAGSKFRVRLNTLDSQRDRRAGRPLEFIRQKEDFAGVEVYVKLNPFGESLVAQAKRSIE